MQTYKKNLFVDIFDNILTDIGDCINDPNSELCGQTVFEQSNNPNIQQPPQPTANNEKPGINFVAAALIIAVAVIAITTVIVFT